jgi:hypothetical protein
VGEATGEAMRGNSAKTIPVRAMRDGFGLRGTRRWRRGDAKSFPFAEGSFSVTVSHVGAQANLNAHCARCVFVEWNLLFVTPW